MATRPGAMAWRDRVESLLYDGERIEERFEIEGNDLVVTSHRVLAFVAGGESQFRPVERPNVTGVEFETSANVRNLVRAVGAGALGTVLLATAAIVDLSAPMPDGVEEAGEVPGVEGVDSAVGLVETLFTVLELGILLGGLFACAIAVGLFGLYVHSRERLLVIRVAGDEDVELPVRSCPGDLLTDVELAISP